MTDAEFNEFMELAEVWADYNVKSEERERREAMRTYLAQFTRPAAPLSEVTDAQIDNLFGTANIDRAGMFDEGVTVVPIEVAREAIRDASISDVRLTTARDALESIALAGMSGSGQESEEGMRDWHARRAWEFIGIAARALAALRPTPSNERG